MPDDDHFRPGRAGLAPIRPGENRYCAIDDPGGIAFSLLRLDPGEDIDLTSRTAPRETAVLALSGKGRIHGVNHRHDAGGDSRGEDFAVDFDRRSWLDEDPTVVHACGAVIRAEGGEDGCELAVVSVENDAQWDKVVYRPGEIRTEHRGRGRLDDSCYRIVRTVFDRENAPDAARLVLGEVVAFPGRWSSYPPHHHEQPEIYYYRFQPEQGYGHAELGEDVRMVRHHDLIRIRGGLDHAQAAAPGYHMYYLWAVRHLPDAPYTGFEFHADHAWLWEG